MANVFFNLLIFPGFLFVCLFGMAAEFVDRKLCARLQNRVGIIVGEDLDKSSANRRHARCSALAKAHTMAAAAGEPLATLATRQ